MSIKYLLLLLLFVVRLEGLYIDQAGLFDWRQQFVGRITHAFVPNVDEKTRKLFVITSENVVAALSLRSGDIVWRQVLHTRPQRLPDGFSPQLAVRAEDVVTVDGPRIHSWIAATGISSWDGVVSDEVPSNIATTPVWIIAKDNLIVLNGEFIRAFDKRGMVKWSTNLPNTKCHYYWMHYNSNERVVIVGADESAKVLAITEIHATTGIVENNTTLVATWFAPNRCVLKNGYLLCLDQGVDSTGAIAYTVDVSKVNGANQVAVKNVGDRKIMSVHYLDLSPSSTMFSVVVADATLVYRISTDASLHFVTEMREVRTVSSVVSQEGEFVVGIDDKYAIRWYDQAGVEKVDWTCVVSLPRETAAPASIHPFVLQKQGSGSVVRTLLVLQDDTAIFVKENGDVVWTRQEGLAGALSVDMLDLPLSEVERNIEEEFETHSKNMFENFARRLSSQVQLVKHVALTAVQEVVGLSGVLDDLLHADSLQAVFNRNVRRQQEKAKFERDYFGLHKMIVIVSASGKIFGLDNVKGDVLWQIYVADFKPVIENDVRRFPLFVLRTTAHHPHPAECAVLGQQADGRHVIVTFDPMKGHVLERKSLPFLVAHAFQFPLADDSGKEGLVLVTADEKVFAYPDTFPSSFASWPQLYTFLLDQHTGAMTGFAIVLKDGALQANRVWRQSISLDGATHVSNVKMKRVNEHVHSQGRVLGDRSVLYKYLNPNLVALSVESAGDSSDAGNANVTVYLMDAVTGRILFSAVHKRCTGPVHMVHAENWIVYSYWSERARRTEIVVLELYEGTSQSDAAHFSSFNSPLAPVVMRQAYVFPQGITAMAVTDTVKGITSRSILVSLPYGGLLQLPKMILDPRRALVPTMEHREEGLSPYIPELQYPTEHIINYNQTVRNVRGIFCAPSGLESTSLVIAYGLDLFYTRTTPSGTFDILKEDFDHWFIAAVLLALLLATIASKRFARHRDLKLAWK